MQTIGWTLVVGEERTNNKHGKTVVNSVNKGLTAIPVLIYDDVIYTYKLYCHRLGALGDATSPVDDSWGDVEAR